MSRAVDRRRQSCGRGWCYALGVIYALVAGNSAAEDAPVVTYHSLTPALALKLAEAATAACAGNDFQVAVAVVDRSGDVQVLLRAQLAGSFTPDIALRKARTAAGFRQSTLGLGARLDERAELRALHQIEDVLMVGGGVPVSYNGAVVAAVGVSGAPTPAADDACAVAGLEAIADDLLF